MGIREDEISLDDIAGAVKKRWKTVFLPAMIISLVLFLVLQARPPRYEAYSLIRIGSSAAKPFETVPSIKVIMHAMPMKKAMTAMINEMSGGRFTSFKSKAVKFEETSELLKISSVSESEERALIQVRAATDLLYDRHKTLYADALKELEVLIKYVKEVINPVPLTSGLSDFRIVPTKIEVDPVVSLVSVVRSNVITASAVFFIILILDLFIALYAEGKKAGDKKYAK